MNLSSYKVWVYVFFIFELFFLLLNFIGDWSLLESLVRATVSAGVVEFLFFLVYLVVVKKKNKGKLKGKIFDQKDSDK